MVEIDLTDSLIEKAETYSKGKTYKRSMRGQEGTKIGTISNATKYDLLVQGDKVEVKTKDRTVRPKPFYECSIPLYNHTHQKPKWFFFLSLLRKGSSYKEAYILGGISYSEMEKKGVVMNKGDVDFRNGWVCKESCININIEELIPPEDMLDILS